jgi:cell division protein FtsB
MNEVITQLLLALISFVGITIIYFLKMSFAKLELLQIQIQDLKIEIEKLKLK